MAGDKGKKAKVGDSGDDEESEQIDGELVVAIEKLQAIQDELEKVNEEASDKVLEVEQKYNEIRRPVYKKRDKIIQSIPDFWLTAFLSHPALCDLLSEEDQKIFKYLVSLDVEDSKDVKSGYTITFNFSLNPYFEDTKLTKTYTFLDEGTVDVTGTTIKWKEGLDKSNNVPHDNKGAKRQHTEDSFFSWFDETQQKDGFEGMSDEVGELIKEDLWVNPLKYFNNDADGEDGEDVDGVEHDDEADSGEDDDNDEQDDDDDEE